MAKRRKKRKPGTGSITMTIEQTSDRPFPFDEVARELLRVDVPRWDLAEGSMLDLIAYERFGLRRRVDETYLIGSGEYQRHRETDADFRNRIRRYSLSRMTTEDYETSEGVQLIRGYYMHIDRSVIYVDPTIRWIHSSCNQPVSSSAFDARWVDSSKQYVFPCDICNLPRVSCYLGWSRPAIPPTADPPSLTKTYDLQYRQICSDVTTMGSRLYPRGSLYGSPKQVIYQNWWTVLAWNCFVVAAIRFSTVDTKDSLPWWSSMEVFMDMWLQGH